MSKMQERDKFNTSCRKHSVEITIDQVTRHIAWERDDCPVCRIISLEQQLQQAHRAGWIQCQREVVTMLQGYMITFKGDGFSMSCSTNDAAIAIAAMEYGGKAND